MLRVEYVLLDLGREKIVARFAAPAPQVAFNLSVIREPCEPGGRAAADARGRRAASAASGARSRLQDPRAPALPMPSRFVSDETPGATCPALGSADSLLSASPESDFSVVFRASFWAAAQRAAARRGARAAPKESEHVRFGVRYHALGARRATRRRGCCGWRRGARGRNGLSSRSAGGCLARAVAAEPALDAEPAAPRTLSSRSRPRRMGRGDDHAGAGHADTAALHREGATAAARGRRRPRQAAEARSASLPAPHPRIPRLLDAFAKDEDGLTSFYLVLEHLAGRDLARVVREEAARIARRRRSRCCRRSWSCSTASTATRRRCASRRQAGERRDRRRRSSAPDRRLVERRDAAAARARRDR